MALRVGIIGAGQAGERHAVGFTACKGAKLVGVADVAENRVVALANRFEATPYTDWREMFNADLDILVVSLPHNMHVAPRRGCCRTGRSCAYGKTYRHDDGGRRAHR